MKRANDKEMFSLSGIILPSHRWWLSRCKIMEKETRLDKQHILWPRNKETKSLKMIVCDSDIVKCFVCASIYYLTRNFYVSFSCFLFIY